MIIRVSNQQHSKEIEERTRWWIQMNVDQLHDITAHQQPPGEGGIGGEDDETFAAEAASLSAATAVDDTQHQEVSNVAVETLDGDGGDNSGNVVLGDEDVEVAGDRQDEASGVGAVEDDDKEFSKWHKNAFGAPVAKASGKFSKEESELVRQSVEEFCAAKQITAARLCSECDHKAELKGAWMEIAKCIPHRSVQSVYRHGIRRLHPFRRGCWSEAECNALVELVARLGKKWSTIQGKLNRSADSCRDKYREMSVDYIKGRWKEQETEMLKLLIREHVGVDPNIDMKEVGRIVEEKGIQISWLIISKRMGKRSRLSCFKKWQKLIGVVPEEEESNGSRKRKANDTAAVESDLVAKRRASAQTASAKDLPGVVMGGDFDEAYSAKIADETVEALGLPDARSSFV